MNKIGILGGSGAFATSHLFNEILKISASDFKSTNDSDFPYIVIINSNLEKIDFKGNFQIDSKFQILKNIQDLEFLGCNIIAIACNTAYQYYDFLMEHISNKTNLINLVEITSNKIANKAKNVGILCSQNAKEANIYSQYIENKNIIYLEDSLQKCLNSCIDSVIRNEIDNKTRFMYRLLIDNLILQGSNEVILGCTELSILKENNSLINIIDSSQVLAVKLNQTYRNL